jgi:hypothetical protein
MCKLEGRQNYMCFSTSQGSSTRLHHKPSCLPPPTSDLQKTSVSLKNVLDEVGIITFININPEVQACNVLFDKMGGWVGKYDDCLEVKQLCGRILSFNLNYPHFFPHRTSFLLEAINDKVLFRFDYLANAFSTMRKVSPVLTVICCQW